MLADALGQISAQAGLDLRAIIDVAPAGAVLRYLRRRLPCRIVARPRPEDEREPNGEQKEEEKPSDKCRGARALCRTSHELPIPTFCPDSLLDPL